MKKTRFILAIFLLFMVTVFMGCSSKAEDTIKDYFTKAEKGEISFAHLVEQSMEDKVINKIESDKFSRQYIDKIYSEFDDNIKSIKYKINSQDVSGNEATVNITVIGDDLSKNFENVLTQTVKYVVQQAYLDNKMSRDEVNKYINKLVTDMGKPSSTERTGDIHLEKVNGKWQVKEDDSLVQILTGIESSTFDNISSDFEKIFPKK